MATESKVRVTRELFRRDAFGNLRPQTDAARDMVKRFSMDDDVWVEAKRARNAKHHRKFWALMTFVHESLSEQAEAVWPTVESLKVEMMYRTRHYTWHESLVGDEVRRVPIPNSISFASMDQTEFEAFYDDCIRVICKAILPGVEDAELRAYVEEGVMEFVA